MAQRASWSRLGIGIAAAIAILGAALFILIFGRVGNLRGAKFTLYVTAGAARGLIRGSEVWLDGQRVGTVKDVSFRPPTTGTTERLVISLEVLKRVRDRIRRDSRVQVRAGTSVIGDQVVYISSGTARQPAIATDDTLHAVDQRDAESMASDFALASKEFPAIIQNVKLLSAQLQSAEGTIGALGMEDQPDFERLRARASSIMKRWSSAAGTIGLARANMDNIRARASRAMAQFDSVRTLLASTEHSLGRFRRDSTLLKQIAGIREEFAAVRQLAADSSGFVPRARTDSAIARSLRRDMLALDSLMRDMRKRPLRYIAF